MEIEIGCREGETVPPDPQGRIVLEGSLLVWESPSGAPKIMPGDIDEAIRAVREEQDRF
jgi:hypothetical protein